MDNALGDLHEQDENFNLTAEYWNLIVEASLIAMYVLSNIVIFGPPCLVQWRAVSQLAGYKRLPTDLDSGTDNPVSGLPPTVQKGTDYITLEELRTPNTSPGDPDHLSRALDQDMSSSSAFLPTSDVSDL